jgi:hypothetical protein
VMGMDGSLDRTGLVLLTVVAVVHNRIRRNTEVIK